VFSIRYNGCPPCVTLVSSPAAVASKLIAVPAL
jgi:hypothetical protein